MRFGNQLRSRSHEPGSWLLLLVLMAALLIPTACVLWFMNVALKSQRDLARQRLEQVSATQASLMATRLRASLDRRAGELEVAAGRGPDAAAAFEQSILSGLADSVIVLRGDGAPAYPSLAIAPGVNEKPTAATAAQDAVRVKLRAGDKAGALRLIAERFSSGPLVKAVDSQGRSIAADEQLLALQLQPANDAAARRLHATLSGYRGSVVPSYQRLFLMDELRRMPVRPEHKEFPLYDAERMAARLLELGKLRPGDTLVRPSGLEGVWKLSSMGGRAIALYRTESLQAQLGKVLAAERATAGFHYVLTPPGPRDAMTDGGAGLLGWRLGNSYDSKMVSDAGRELTAAYMWLAFLFIAMMAVLGLIGGRVLQRQMRVARLKTDLISAVSHELKTPLASTKLLVELLLDDPGHEPGKCRQYLEMIASENDRLGRLIDNFLTFSRMERGYRKFQPVATTAQAVVEQTVQSMGERFQPILQVEIRPGIPQFEADEDSLVTVLRNLLDNAYKYSGEPKSIRVRAWHEDSRVRFAVTDNGIGIAPREQKKIFRRFYQVDRRLSRQTGGVGLGLSIVEFIIRSHGGTVAVESRPGAGSTFTVCLPCPAEGVAA